MQVLITSPWVPAEWIRAYGFEPRVAWGPDFHSKPSNRCGHSLLSVGGQGVCAFAQRCVDLARQHSALPMIFDSSCDQMRRSFDALVADQRLDLFLFNLPATWQTASVRQLYRSELSRLGRWLVKLGGSTPANDVLRQVIRESQQARLQLLAAVGQFSARQYAEAIASFQRLGSVQWPAKATPAADSAVPLALVGTHFPASQWDLLDRIEQFGGRIVLNATPAGERSLATADGVDASAEALEDPAEFLTTRFFQSSLDIFQRPNRRLYTWLQERMVSRGARGIVLWSYVNCDLWRAEAQTMKEVFGLPVCLLEGDELEGCSARTAGRLQAFLEVLR